VTEPVPARLPPRPPRSLVVHWLVDSAVAFVATVFLAWLVAFPLIPLAVISLVIGAVAAPYTRRAEMRALAARAEHPGSPSP